MFKSKKLRQMLSFELDRAVNDRIQMWWLAKSFWILKFKDATKALNWNIQVPPYKESASDFWTYPYEVSTKIYFVVELLRKVWTWFDEILNGSFCKSDLFS